MRCISIKVLIAGAALSLATVVPAAADFKVQTPDAETGEIAIEPLGDYGHDPLRAHSGELSLTQEFGVTSASPRETIRWQLEYEIHF